MLNYEYLCDEFYYDTEYGIGNDLSESYILRKEKLYPDYNIYCDECFYINPKKFIIDLYEERLLEKKASESISEGIVVINSFIYETTNKKVKSVNISGEEID